MSRLTDRELKTIGMKHASNIAEQCQVTAIGGLSPESAAEAMKKIIVGNIRAHAEALENSGK